MANEASVTWEVQLSYFEGDYRRWVGDDWMTISPEEYTMETVMAPMTIDWTPIAAYSSVAGYTEQPVSAESVYEPVLGEYRRAAAENFCNIGDYTYVPGMFSPESAFYRGEQICYGFYDLMGDGQPELAIALYYEESGDYEILDVYGTEGNYARRLGENVDQYPSTVYDFRKEGILKSVSVSGGFSAGETVFYQLYPGTTDAEIVEDVGYDGMRNCYRHPFSDAPEPISVSEYEEILGSYQTLDIPFEWKALL